VLFKTKTCVIEKVWINNPSRNVKNGSHNREKRRYVIYREKTKEFARKTKMTQDFARKDIIIRNLMTQKEMWITMWKLGIFCK